MEIIFSEFCILSFRDKGIAKSEPEVNTFKWKLMHILVKRVQGSPNYKINNFTSFFVTPIVHAHVSCPVFYT